MRERQVLDGDSMRDSIFHMMNDYIENTVDMIVSPGCRIRKSLIW